MTTFFVDLLSAAVPVLLGFLSAKWADRWHDGRKRKPPAGVRVLAYAPGHGVHITTWRAEGSPNQSDVAFSLPDDAVLYWKALPAPPWRHAGDPEADQ